MRNFLITQIIKILLSVVSEDLFRTIADKILDVIEDAIENTSTPWDDRVLLPLIKVARSAFNIPDSNGASTIREVARERIVPGDPDFK